MPNPSREKNRMVLFVDETMFVDGHGYRVSIVIEGEDCFHPTGDWPYDASKGHKLPWFYDPTIEDARRQVAEHNQMMGIDERTAALIVAQSMNAGLGKGVPHG